MVHRMLRAALASMVAVVVAGLMGCQVDRAGMTLPSPYYLRDDVQYFAPGPDFKLANEAAALQQSALGAQPSP